ncbi:MAG: glycine cleavage system protein T, partial [Bacteroidota bacterium]|nr:glycine cleavage system protein T [Bacteroidota bacterium]
DDIGVVTSGTLSPSLQIPIGMAYVPAEYATPGTLLTVKAGTKLLDASVVSLPFIKQPTMSHS